MSPSQPLSLFFSYDRGLQTPRCNKAVFDVQSLTGKPLPRLAVDIALLSPIRFSHWGLAPRQSAPMLGTQNGSYRVKHDLTLIVSRHFANAKPSR